MLAERHLLAAALLLAFSGILTLWILLHTAHLPVEELTAIAENRAGEEVRVAGQVVRVRHTKNITLLTLAERVEWHAVIFDRVNVTPGLNVTVEGRIQSYHGEPELVITRVEVQQ